MSDVATRPKADAIEMVMASRQGLAAALADRIGVERFTRAAVTVLRTTPALRNCTPESVLGGLFVAAQLGLEIGGPLAYAHIVPYGREAQLIVGVRGFVELFYRAGARSVRADIIREGDQIERHTDESGRVLVRWVDADPLNPERPAIGALATVILASGESLQELMSKAQILKRKPRTSRSGPWSDWEDEMWKKTVLRQCAKTARLSSDDLALAIEVDQSITTGTDETARRKHVPVGDDNTDTAIDLSALPAAESAPAPSKPVDKADPLYEAAEDEK
jgi:recombination protein RecT